MNRTTMRLWVYACPEDQRAAALAAIRDTLGEDACTEFGFEVSGELNLAEPYYTPEFLNEGTGEGLDLAVALVAAAPGVSFLMRVSPDECEPGAIYAYTPALGHYHGEINGDSEVVVTLERLLPLMAIPENGDSPGARRRSRDSILQAYGKPWLDDFAANRPDI